MDFQPLSKLAILMCGCKRPLFDDAAIAEFERARPNGKKVLRGSTLYIEVAPEVVEAA